MSTVSFNFKNGETVDDITKILTNISFFLSTLSLNLNFAQIVKYYSGNEVVMIEITDRIISKYHGNILIDNHRIPSGIKIAFEKSYYRFLELMDELSFAKYTHLIVELYQQKYIELKIATLVIAYEHLLLKYLVHRGVVTDLNEDINIQQKLGRVNKELKFIPKQLLDDEFRSGIRNPLFHTGSIPTKSSKELREIYLEYLDLLMRIYLRIISYDSHYISRKDHNTPSQV